MHAKFHLPRCNRAWDLRWERGVESTWYTSLKHPMVLGVKRIRNSVIFSLKILAKISIFIYKPFQHVIIEIKEERTTNINYEWNYLALSSYTIKWSIYYFILTSAEPGDFLCLILDKITWHFVLWRCFEVTTCVSNKGPNRVLFNLCHHRMISAWSADKRIYNI